MDYNRRQFIRTSGLFSLAVAPAYSLAEPFREKDLDITQFFSRYEHEYSTYPKKVVSSGHIFQEKDPYVFYGKIGVSLCLDKVTNEDCLKTLISAAIDKNVVVYDKEKSEKVTPRLLSLMSSVMCRNVNSSTTITDYIISAGADDREMMKNNALPYIDYDWRHGKYNGKRVHKLSSSQTRMIRGFMWSSLYRNLPYFVLALSNPTKHCVIPHDKQTGRYGVAVLTNQCVLLGKC